MLMPSRRVHKKLSRIISGDDCERTHELIDYPYRFLGRKHRILFHDPISASVIGYISDGYKGVPGIGEKKVVNFIEPGMTEEELMNGVLEAFESKGLSVDDATQQVRLADMHQYNPENNELTLFSFNV